MCSVQPIYDDCYILPATSHQCFHKINFRFWAEKQQHTRMKQVEKLKMFFFFWKNWQKCIYYYFSDFVREERCWSADCQWRYAAAGLSPNLMLWLWADVFREIDWNRGKDSVEVRAKLFRENNAVILASIVYHVLFISQFQWKKFAILFVRNKIEILTQNSLLRHSIHVYFLHHRRMHHGPNSPASLIDP